LPFQYEHEHLHGHVHEREAETHDARPHHEVHTGREEVPARETIRKRPLG
jgi:hypothetical protein